MDSDLLFPCEYLICRLKRPRTNDHLTEKQKEINNSIRAIAKRNADTCIEKLQPFYKAGSLNANNFFISSQLLAGEKFNQLQRLAPEYKYEIAYLSPDAKNARSELVINALLPWIRLLAVAFEIKENPDEVLWGYLTHAAVAVSKLENTAIAASKLHASKSGSKKRTVEMTDLHKGIVALHDKGIRQKTIALELDTSESTVSRVIKKQSKSFT
jgi:hypothetical protein